MSHALFGIVSPAQIAALVAIGVCMVVVAREENSAWLLASFLLSAAAVLDFLTGPLRFMVNTGAAFCLFVGLTRAYHHARAARKTSTAATKSAAHDARASCQTATAATTSAANPGS